MIQIPTDDGSEMGGFLALPDGPREQPVPGVLVLHEILGLNDDIRRIARRFADAGYAALAPDLYSGRGPRALCVFRTLRALARSDGSAFAAIDAARRWLADRPEVDASRLGVAGFCMGGGFALLYAARSPANVVASFYGDVPKRTEPLTGICPVLGGYGGRDRIFGPAGRRLDTLLDELAVEHDVVVYPEAGHSYMNHHAGVVARLGSVSPMRVGYDEAAAEDSWRRLLAFFGRHLGA